MIKNILCADIGGTQARFAHFELENETLNLRKVHTCPTLSLNTTLDALEAATHCGIDPYKAHAHIWGIAGPIEENGVQAKLTNAPLRLDFKDFLKHKNEPFLLVNDFTLQAWASVSENIELLPIINKNAPQRATRAILGAGTGLGTAALMPIKTKSWSILQAEGGHTDMPFYGDEELDFANFAKDYLQQNRLSAEDILSARGLSLLHGYLHAEHIHPADAAQNFKEDSTQLRLYARFLGRFCKNWALNTLSMGGIYLSGGVLIKNPHILQNPSFKTEFYTAPKGMQGIIESIPVMLMTNEHAGLWGGAHAAKTILSGG